MRLSQLLLSQKRFTESENLAFEAHNEVRQHLDEQDPVRKAATNNLIQVDKKQGRDEIARTVK